jgi:hypothetical protein
MIASLFVIDAYMQDWLEAKAAFLPYFPRVFASLREKCSAAIRTLKGASQQTFHRYSVAGNKKKSLHQKLMQAFLASPQIKWLLAQIISPPK